MTIFSGRKWKLRKFERQSPAKERVKENIVMGPSVGRCIIKKITLSVQQASEVCRDLEQLENTGIWDCPTWATELSKHYHANRWFVGETHSVIHLEGWRAVAKAYKDSWERQAWKELGE